jgi:hypothetical protein
MSKTFNAAKSLYNSTALSGNVGGQKREQTVLTPDWLLDVIRAVATIGLDPCTTLENPVGASEFICLSPKALELQEKLAALPMEDKTARTAVAKELKPLLLGGGLQADWLQAGLVFVNPPYDMLHAWMLKCANEADAGSCIYLLAPFRPQRKWFVEYTRGYRVVSLKPFPFVGHRQALPAPLCLVCYNLPVPNLGDYETGCWRVE